MSAFGKKFNKDDIAERNAIAGILHVLHKELKFEYTHDEHNIEEVTVPFYYSIAGDERFLMDMFLNEFDSSKAELNYDSVPRGILNLESSSIVAEGLTNPHLRLPEVVEEKDESTGDSLMKTYYSIFTSIPIQFSISCRIKVSSHRDLLIISEILKKEFFRNKRFYYDYKGLRVPGNITFPESYERENPIEYTFGEDRNQELLVSLDVETYLPAYNKNTRIFAGDRMSNFDNSLFPKCKLNK